MDDLFTRETAVTLAGSTAAVTAVCNALQRAFNFNPAWLGLGVATILAEAAVFTTGKATIIDYGLGLINGCLIFGAAVGTTRAGDAIRGTGAQAEPKERPFAKGGAGRKRGFWSPWI